MNRYQYLIISLIFMTISNCVIAQEDSVKSPFAITAYIDTYLAYDFNEPLDGIRQYANMAAKHNEFNINQAYLLGSYEGSKLRGNLGIQTGTYAQINYGAEPSDVYRMIQSANVGINVYKNIWIDAGVFGGHFGYESVESISNEAYSRAFATEYTPYYQTGIKATVNWTNLELTMIAVNGWQNIAETNKTKSFGINVNYTPNENIEINYGNYYGNEGNITIGDKFRFFNNLYVRYQFSDKLHVASVLDFGWQEDWITTENHMMYFLTLISEYKFAEKLSIAGRFEQVSDPNQLLVATNIANGFEGQVYTVTLNNRILQNAIFRIEGKYYSSQYNLFNTGESADMNNLVLMASIAAMISR